jgi:hypothetical protein
MEPFLRAMRRRLERDRNRVHAYHDDLRSTSLKRLAALACAEGDRAQPDRRREMLRVEAIEREYCAKLDDLRHNCALRVTVEWVQALDLYVPVQRFDVLIRRRKGERVVHLDWHPLVKAAEPPLCEAGLGLDRVRLVCDDKLHLTEPAGQGPAHLAPSLSVARAPRPPARVAGNPARRARYGPPLHRPDSGPSKLASVLAYQARICNPVAPRIE